MVKRVGYSTAKCFYAARGQRCGYCARHNHKCLELSAGVFLRRCQTFALVGYDRRFSYLVVEPISIWVRFRLRTIEKDVEAHISEKKGWQPKDARPLQELRKEMNDTENSVDEWEHVFYLLHNADDHTQTAHFISCTSFRDQLYLCL